VSAARRAPRGFLARYARLWIWGALILSGVICATMAWLHVEQQRALSRATETLDNVRRARIELAQGMLHVALADKPGSPFDRAEGVVRMEQAMRSLDRGLASRGQESRHVRAVERAMRECRALLGAISSSPSPEVEVRLRVVAHELEHEARKVDEETRAELTRTSDRVDRVFAWTATLGVLMVCAVCWVVFAVGRATTSSERERARAEEEIRALNAELERRVEDRTSELARVNEELTRTNGGLATEIAERRQLEDQIRRHADRAHALELLSTAFAEAGPDLDALYQRIVRRTTEMIGDTCLITLLSDDGEHLVLVALGHDDPSREPLMAELAKGGPSPADVGLTGRVVRTGQPLLIPELDVDAIRSQLNPAYRAYVDAHGMSSVLIVPLRARGKVLGTLGVSRDAAGRPYAEDDQALLQDLADRAALALDNARLFAELRHAREVAERASLSKSEFLASMSHELRTPLNAVLGLSESLEADVYGPLTTRQVEIVRRIGESGAHLLALINDILDLSKIESGQMTLDVGVVSLEEICRASARLVQGAAMKKGHRMSLDVTPGKLEGDARRLVQVLVNLLGNAVKFTPHGGEIDLLAWIDPAGAVARIQVRDNGIGIARDQIGRLFQPFVQLDSSLARKHAGTGLGLALVRRFVEMHGGSVEVESEVDRGSTFTVVLPLHTAETPSPRAVAAVDAPPRRKV
jgi:signal transduction histidine kinase